MSKVVMSLPEGMVKDGVIGALASLICYVILQFLVAFMISKEVIGEQMLYSSVCVSAGISSFVGCLCGMARAKVKSVLSAATVVAVFLVLTMLIGFCFGGLEGFCDDFARVGISMSVGGLAAALVNNSRRRRGKKTRENIRARRGMR